MSRSLGLFLLLGLALGAGPAPAPKGLMAGLQGPSPSQQGLSPRPAIQVFAEGAGLPSLAVEDLTQDANGQVWIATQKGVAWYAGGSFHALEGHPAVEGVWASTLLSTQEGLWIGTVMDGLLFRGAQGWKAWKTANDLPLRRINQCLEDGRGGILVVSVGNPVLRVEGDRLVPEAGMPPMPVTMLLRTVDGWLAGTDQGLWREAAGRWEPVPEVTGAVRCLAQLGTQTLVGTAKEAYLGADGRWTRLSQLSGETLQSACAGPGLAGRPAFWAITRHKLFCLEQGLVQEIPFNPVGTPPQVMKVSVTVAAGSSQVWVSTYSGLFRLQPGGWNRLDPDRGPGNAIAFAMAHATDGSMWFGDTQGRIHRRLEGRWQSWVVPMEDGRTNVIGLCALEGPGHPMLVAFSQSRLWHWDGRQWRKVGGGDPKAPLHPNALRPGWHQGEAGAWVSSDFGLYFWSQKRGLQQVLPFGRPIRWVLPDPTHPGWVYFGGMLEDVLLWDGRGMRLIAQLQGARFTSSAMWVRGLEGQALRIATVARGVVTLDAAGKTVASWTRATLPGWPSDSVLSLASDSEGRTWVGTDAGLAAMSAAGELLATYTRKDGLPSDLCSQSALVVEENGGIWAGTSRGVAYLPKAHLPPPSLPALRLLSLISEAGPFQPGETLRYPARQIAIDFELPLFHREDDVRYRAILEGLDVRAVPWSKEPRARYPSLPAGSFRLQVWAMDGHGRQVGPLLVPFRVAVSRWLHPGMLALYALAFAGVGYTLFRYKLARLNRRNQELSEAVAKATSNLHQINDRLYHLNDEKNRIIGVAAHDLRNPLSAIMLTCELMEETIPEAQAPDLERIRQLGRTMNNLMADLLNVHAIEANIAEAPQVEALALSPLLEEIHRTYAGKAKSKDISLALDLPAEDLVALGDRRHLLRVLDNLVNNALKFTPCHRRVWLRARPEGESIRLEVQDEGPGLTAEDLTRVFGAYARLSASPTAGEPSVGLGLSIVKKLTEAMGGGIGVDSVAGSGATFWIKLPQPPQAE